MQPDAMSVYGFVHVGEWLLDGKLKSGVRPNLEALKNERVVYLFAVDARPKYVGVCQEDTTTLMARMNRYKSMADSGTNENVAKLIRDALLSRKNVSIWALKPPDYYRHGDLKIDLVKGLENPLIDRFKPEWNRRK